MAAPGRPADDASDESLMLAYAGGSAASFDRLYARHKGPVYRYLLRHCANAATADELFQDVWTNLIRARARYAPTARVTTWLYPLAHHRLVDHWRVAGQAEALKRKSGARGLRAIMENTMLDVMYEIPSQSNIRECI